MVEIELIQGDITALNVDAVVNAANNGLLGGGGVDGAIHMAAGPALVEECRKLPATDGVRCPTGEARITGAGNMKCKYIIHTVGPVYDKTKERWAEEKLSACYRASLTLAAEHGASSIAFPNISCGVYGYPIEDAAETATRTVHETCAGLPSIKKVVFCCFGRHSYDVYKKLLGIC